jgi:hypothetical protein
MAAGLAETEIVLGSRHLVMRTARAKLSIAASKSFSQFSW